MKITRVVNRIGVPFNVKIVLKGDSYGRTGSLTHKEVDPLIEFYDGRYNEPDGFGELGQFVSRYYLSTLRNRKGNYGLILEGCSDSWFVDSENVEQVLSWAKTKTLPLEKSR